MRGASSQWPAELLLVRHGESAGNVARDEAERRRLDRIQIDARRDTDVPLSRLGEQQAEAFGRWLGEQPRGRRPTAVLASPYVRAFRTAEIALQAGGLSEVPLRIDERLRERELGVFDRLTKRGIEREFPDQARLRSALGKFYHRPPGGESWCDVILRLRSVMEMIARELPEERMLIVCHSAVVLCFRYLLEQMTEEQILAIDRAVELANCSVTSYALEGQRLALRRFNFVAPLEEHGARVTTEPDVAVAPR